MKYSYYQISKNLLYFLLILCATNITIAGEGEKPDFKIMNSIDHANHVFSDGNKNYLVIFKDYYKKEVSAYLEVPKILPGYAFVSHQCFLDAKYDEKIIAYVKNDPKKEKWNDVRFAWIMDIPNKSIESV